MREMSVTEQRYKAVLAVIGDGRTVILMELRVEELGVVDQLPPPQVLVNSTITLC
jgi:hypothetical protein